MAHSTTESTLACESDGDCPTGRRNRFFRFKSMGAEEFLAEQEYFLGRRRLINRSVLGFGVVAGFKMDGPRVRPDERSGAQSAGARSTGTVATGATTADATAPDAATSKATRIGEGFALDQHGRELVLLEPTALSERNTFLVDPTSSAAPRALRQAAPGRYLLRVHYAERRTGDVALGEQCGCGQSEQNFVCETVVFSVEHLCCDDRCPCAEGDCDRHCACGGDACCQAGRGPHACLCQWISETSVPRPAKPLCRWNGYWIDPCDGVGLACITLGKSCDPCEPIAIVSIDDDCSPRRLVKNNDLLYDLLRGCDLTRIEHISWGEWHRNPSPMPWEVFLGFLGPGPASEDSDVPVISKFEVTFSGPVQVKTLTPDCFTVRFAVSHEDTGWYESRVVRVLDLDPVRAPGDDAEYVRGVRLALDPDWHREISKRPSKFRREGATVEIEVRGDFILDCHGQPVDANAVGFALHPPGPGKRSRPSGNGTPGGTLLSVFRVDQRAAATA